MSNPFAKKVDEFLVKKWDRVFYTFFDLDKGGTINWKDFEILFEKVKELRGEHSKEYQICCDSMLMVWKGLLNASKGIDMAKEVDFSLEISINEWHEIWKKYDPKHVVPWQTEYLKFMFFLIDASGDKVIDEGEYAEVLKLYDISETASLRSFKKLSADANGKPIQVTYGEFIRLWNEYFTSPNPDAPGSHLFGTVG